MGRRKSRKGEDMKRLIILFFILLSCLGSIISPAFADDDYEHYEDDNDELIEEVGEAIGWGSVILGSAAFVLFPLKRSAKTLVKITPTEYKSKLGMVLRFFSKSHVVIGIFALILGICHGLLMYYEEGALSARDLIGVVSIVALFIGAILGTLVWKFRKRSLLKPHFIVVLISGVTAVIHIILS